MWKRASIAICLALGTVGIGCSVAQAQRTIAPAPAFTGRQLSSFPTTEWLTNGGDLFNRRYSPLRQITRENVAGLKAVWRARLGGSGLEPKYSGEAQPLVHDGVIYVVTGANDVFAISVDGGQTLWSYAAHLDPSNDVICCGWTAAASPRRRQGVCRPARRQARGADQQTGDVVWAVQAERWQDGFTITSAPLYYDGLVITGFAGAEYGVRGRVKAYDARRAGACGPSSRCPARAKSA